MESGTQPSNGPVSSRVALLIDGENISSGFAGRIIIRAAKRGCLNVKCVFGNVQVIPGWNNAPGFRVVHSGNGKNSADMLLAISAMELAHGDIVDSFVIASSDGDFSHLAHHLREKGFGVFGIGEKKAPDCFRKACSDFDEVRTPTVKESSSATTAAKITPEDSDTNRKIAQLIKINSNGHGMKISLLGGKMHSKHKIKISERPEKTWRAYLLARPDLFSCDSKGANACVRLK